MHKRIEWIDVAKALGIIAVVVGHILPSGLTTQLIYWWHMPLFFIIGGFFLKPVSKNDIGQLLKKRVWPMLIIYFSAGVGLVLLYQVMHPSGWASASQQFVSLLIGGRTLNDYTTTMWFLNVYLLTLLVVTMLISVTSRRWFRLLVATLALLFGTLYDHVPVTIFGYQTLPWNLDIVLLTTFFMLVGYELFQMREQLRIKVWHVATLVVIVAVLIALKVAGFLPFKLSLKSHLVTADTLPSGGLLLIIPLLCCLLIFVMAYGLSKTPLKSALNLLGRHSLAIMLSHKALFDICNQLGITAMPVQILIGLIVPVVLVTTFGIIRSRLTRQLVPQKI